MAALKVGHYIQIVEDPRLPGRFMLLTAFLGEPLGMRLERGYPLPAGPVDGLTLKQAENAFAEWERILGMATGKGMVRVE